MIIASGRARPLIGLQKVELRMKLLLTSSVFLLVALGICGAQQAEERPTLGGVRIAVLVPERALLGSIKKFQLSLGRAGWESVPFVAADVVEFRAAHPEYPLVVEGAFGDEIQSLSFIMHWEKNRSQGFPSISDTAVTFDDVVAEFIEFVQRPHVQHYLFTQRRGQQSSPYQALLDEAWNKTNSAQWALAIADVEKALKLPDAKPDTHPLFLLGYCYKELGQFEKAIDSFKRVLELQKDHSGALLDLGNLAFDLGDYDEAKLRYQQVVDLKTSNTLRATWNLGLLNLIKENWESALDHFRLLKTKPNYSEAASRRILEIEKRIEEIRKRDALPNLISNALVGIWGGLISALVMSFV